MSENSPPNGSQQTELFPMSSSVDSPVKISASQEKALELRASGRAYGRSTPVLLASYDPNTSSWRTSQRCLVEGWTRYSETWPRSGLMRSGTAYQLPPLVPLTEGTGFGSWPTPRKNDAEKRGNLANDIRNGLPAAARYWPNPTTRDWKDGSAQSCGGVPINGLLGRAIHWPTPAGPNDTGGVVGLGGGAGNRQKLYRMLGYEEGKKMACGSLNPYWVEWLMGFPIGHTALVPSETP